MRALDVVYAILLNTIISEYPDVEFAYEIFTKRPDPRVKPYVLLRLERSNLRNFGIGGEKAEEVGYVSINILTTDQDLASRLYSDIVDVFKSRTTLYIDYDPNSAIELQEYSFERAGYQIYNLLVADNVALSIGSVVKFGEKVGVIISGSDNEFVVYCSDNGQFYYVEPVSVVDQSSSKRMVYDLKIIVKVKGIY